MNVRKVQPFDFGGHCNEDHDGALVPAAWRIEIQHHAGQSSCFLLCDACARTLAEKLVDVVVVEEGGQR